MKNLKLKPYLRSMRTLNILLFIFILFLSSTGSVLAQERDMDVYPYWEFYSNTSNSLYEALAEKAFAQLEKRKNHVAGLQTKEDWTKRQQYIKSTLEEIVGPFPARTPLNPVITDTIYKDGMIVEKLYFESRPDYYVTAIFCKPENASGKLPTILFCSGHTEEGFRSETYQHMIFNYVKKGFAVLAFDPIGQGERIRYLDDQGNPRMGATKEHSYPGSQAFLAGISPANFFIWDGIRSVDYLLTREDVDPDRLGITGRSGGGTQTAYIAAMDDRLYAAAPECYITTFDKLLKSMGPQDAEQNLMHGIARGIDLPDYIEVRAPKPTMIVSTTRDIFSIQGVRDTYREAKRAYQAFGKSSHLQKVEDDAGHESTKQNREATYAFFRKHLRHPGNSNDEKVPVFKEQELWVTPNGNVYLDLGGEDIYSLAVKYLDESEAYHPAANHDLRIKLKELSGYKEFKSSPEVVFSGRTNFSNYDLEKYLIRGAYSHYLPVVWCRPHKESGKVILWLDDRGKKEAGKEENEIDKWLQEGYSVVMADLSGMGELGGGYQGGDARIQGVPLNVWYAGILTDKSLVSLHAEEINLIKQFINQSYDRPADLILLGRGMVGADLLHAAFLEDWNDPIVMIDLLATYRSILDDREYDPRFLMSSVAGGLPYYDLPDLIQKYGAKNKIIVNPVNSNGDIQKGMTEEYVKYADNGDEIYSLISAWLK